MVMFVESPATHVPTLNDTWAVGAEYMYLLGQPQVSFSTGPHKRVWWDGFREFWSRETSQSARQLGNFNFRAELNLINDFLQPRIIHLLFLLTHPMRQVGQIVFWN